MKFIIIIYFIFKFNSCNQNIDKNYVDIKYKTNYTNILHQTNTIKKNAILGVITKYSWETVSPFFKSLIKSNFKNCDIVIFVRAVSQILINNLKKIGALVYSVPEEYKNISIINGRWKLYADFLRNNRDKYNLIFCADVRDTIFQKDLFNYYENNTNFLGLAIEDGTLNQHYNKRWLINYCGVECFEKIMTERIVCAGSMWGTIDKLIQFSDILWEKLSNNKNTTDQGLVNYLIYYEKIFDDYLVKSDNYGPIMTIALSRGEDIHLDSENNILNLKGEIASVVHQYDRKHDIALKLKKKFCPELFESKEKLQSNSLNNRNKLI